MEREDTGERGLHKEGGGLCPTWKFFHSFWKSQRSSRISYPFMQQCFTVHLRNVQKLIQLGNVGKKLLCKWRDFYYVWCWKRAHHIKNQWCDARKLPKSRRQKTTLLREKTLEIHSAAAFANSISMCMSNSLNWSSNHVNDRVAIIYVKILIFMVLTV